MPITAATTDSTVGEIGNDKSLQKSFFSNFEEKKLDKSLKGDILAQTMAVERDLVIDTLLEIERICENLRDQTIAPTTSSASLSVLSDSVNNNKAKHCSCSSNTETSTLFNGTLAQIIMHSSLRTQVNFFKLNFFFIYFKS